MADPPTLPPSLDFLSPDFDALEALHTKGLQPPNPRVRPLDNLASCRRLLPQELPESLANVAVKAPRSAESIAAQARAEARTSLLQEKAAAKARQIKILDAIAEKLDKGPLALLAACYKNQTQIQVWTRHTHGVRGILTGFLVAFDKHLNMVLKDVDEEYTVRLHVPRLVSKRGRAIAKIQVEGENCIDSKLKSGSSEASEVNLKDDAVNSLISDLKELKLFPKLEYRRRHLNQVFLRGDIVVMVRKKTLGNAIT
ncbi:hypothetical protein O6H91_17G020500 [Diphasiastrum complanatum]|uniref:Uncharacterized protein n=1 Tax=Diphasiastrum complanatum TaxID=34168 RepID=A0ACC2B4R5_DIPCM|nr:hypothetical protein O6H91_17G020500 [Diphasiastrum complanatum]